MRCHPLAVSRNLLGGVASGAPQQAGSVIPARALCSCVVLPEALLKQAQRLALLERQH
jgi:hypothetical protein